MDRGKRKRWLPGVLAALVALYGAGQPAESQAGEPPAAMTLTVTKAVSMALEGHPDLRAAQERLRTAETALDSARAAFQPEVTAAASGGGRLQQDADSQTLDATIGMKWNVYRGGSDTATVDKSSLEASASGASLERERQTLVSETVDRYLAALTARGLVTVREKNVTLNRDLLERVRAQFEAGERSVTDVYQQEAETEKAAFELTSALGDYDAALLRLLEVIGAAEGSVGELVDVARVSEDALLPAGSAVGIAEQALVSRADLAAQRSTVAAAEQGIAVARAVAKPTVDLSATVGSSYSSLVAGGIGEQFGSDSIGTSVGISVSVPLWDRHAARNAVSQATSQREIERSSLQSMERQVRLDVGTALAGLKTAQAQAASASKQRDSAAKALEAAEARYEVGASTLLEITQARSLLLEAASSVVEARYAILQKAVALAYAAGNPDSTVALLSAGEESR